MKKWLATGLMIGLLGLSLGSNAREIQVPLQLHNEFLRQILLRQVYTGPQHTAQMWDEGSRCNSLVLFNPQISSVGPHIRLISEGKAKIGTPIGNRCIPFLNWQGMIEVFQQPVLGPQLATVHFRTVKSNIYNLQGGKNLTTGKLWDGVKKYVHPKLSQVQINLHPLLAKLRNLLPLILPRQDRAQVQTALHSLTLTEAQTTQTGMRVTLRFALPNLSYPQTPPPPEPALSPEELQRWETAWRHWDAFLTFVIKHAAAESKLEEFRLLLLEILLDARHDIGKALASPTPGTPDPIRALFLSTWKRLAPVLRRLSLNMSNERALRYLTFITASDALQTIDQLRPLSGLDISTDGLRRLARTIAPQEKQDPLSYGFEVDPSLRRSFGLGPPLSLPKENPDLGLSRWFWRSAWAANDIDRSLIARLNQWAPTSRDIDAYLPIAHQLLDQTTSHLLHRRQLEPQTQSLYRWLLLATAWQESCWRQFIKQGDSIQPLRSHAGSVGLMQVNQNVWRGFYDVNSLNENIAYNTKAGGEILMHYLVDYAIRKGEHKKTDNFHNLARAAYAAYNGGPRHLSRYRKANTPKSLRRIDAFFWDKYQTIKQGNELAVAQCFGVEASSLQSPPERRR
ncbi:lytic transglycosylase domain-containing protein [Nitrosococcus wardiae]|uniref:Lytic transglycosylase domain-containing protein n=1 Tax=Nitrosococcus wardiae TaxID=1814290 RepID=A0A4P7BVP4_9GAMM|nr:lytic transglycosylase domain-containing protein [Nitrosococcus wardiae]QBQ53249.1 lytic transglycosylase domain-containing protein [Nitrosococcus wardiae]